VNKGERLDELLAAFMKIGVSGATVLEGIGYGEKTAYRVGRLSFVRGRIEEMLESKPKHRVIMSLVDTPAQADMIVSTTREVCSRRPPVKAHVIVLPAVTAYTFGHEPDRTGEKQ
ncbi:MAG: hypothetical protein ACPLRM_09550, partial [Anaerolineae bacterium]